MVWYRCCSMTTTHWTKSRWIQQNYFFLYSSPFTKAGIHIGNDTPQKNLGKVGSNYKDLNASPAETASPIYLHSPSPVFFSSKFSILPVVFLISAIFSISPMFSHYLLPPYYSCPHYFLPELRRNNTSCCPCDNLISMCILEWYGWESKLENIDFKFSFTRDSGSRFREWLHLEEDHSFRVDSLLVNSVWGFLSSLLWSIDSV